MGLIRLRVREFAAEKAGTIKEVSERSNPHNLNLDRLKKLKTDVVIS